MKEKRRGGFYCCINYVSFCLTSHTKPLMGSDERTIYKDKIINDKSNLGLMYALAILSRVASDFYINLFLCFVIYLLWRILKDNHGIYTSARKHWEKYLPNTTFCNLLLKWKFLSESSFVRRARLNSVHKSKEKNVILFQALETCSPLL